jgi:hypothetical protein
LGAGKRQVLLAGEPVKKQRKTEVRMVVVVGSKPFVLGFEIGLLLMCLLFLAYLPRGSSNLEVSSPLGRHGKLPVQTAIPSHPLLSHFPIKSLKK